MRDKELYARILGVKEPWRVADVDLNLRRGEVVVHVEHGGGEVRCPQCGHAARQYDTRQRRWRHLDTCQYGTFLAAKVPRVRCPQHRVLHIEVPWAEDRARLTALCEAVVIRLAAGRPDCGGGPADAAELGRGRRRDEARGAARQTAA